MGKKVVTKIGKMNISGVIDVEDLIPVKYQVLKNSSTNKVETYSLQTEWAEYYSSSLITCGFVSKTFYKDYIDNHYEYKNIDVYKMDNVLISKYRLASEKRKYLGFDNKLIDEPLSKNGIYMSIDCYIQYLSKLITNNTSVFTNEERQTINQFLDEFVLCYNTNNLSKEHDYILELDLLQKISNVLIDKQIGFNMLCIIDPFSKSTTEYDTFKILGLCDYGEYNSLEVNSMELINYLEIDRDSTFIYNSKYVKDKNAKYSGVFISTKGFSLNDFRSIINKSRKESKENSYFVINHSADEAIFVEFSSFSEYRNVFLWAGIITGVFSIMLLSNFISLSITNKEHEIGILRAVGAKKSDIYKIFFFEALCIVLICLAIGIGVSNLAISVLNNLFASTFKIGFLVYGVPSFLFELFSAIFGLFASTALPVYSLSKKKPVDTIKSL